jgi:hypothetical protein
MVDLDDELGCPGNSTPGMAQAGGYLDAPHGAIDSIGEASVGDARNLDGESGVERKPAGTNRHLRGLGHQVILELDLCGYRYAATGNRKRCGRTESQCCQSDHLIVRKPVMPGGSVTSYSACLC